MKFFLDANMPRSSLKLFEELGIEVIYSRDVGLGNVEDKEIFEYAIRNKCILVTKDLEFGDSHLFPLESILGVIILRLPYYFTASQISEHLKIFFNSIELKELENSIVTLKLGRFRIRRLK